MQHTLFVVGTPLGNVEDWSPRAQRVLASVSAIAAEDTRVTSRLLAACGIENARLLTYTDAFGPKKAQRLAHVLDALSRGDVALVSDAGMPGIADPGFELVQAALAAGHAVMPTPGPSAVATALAVSGLPAERFLFLGFLPRQAAARQRVLRRAADEPGTLICFETPHRIRESLADVATVLGNRRMAIARELTKPHEEIWHGQTADAPAWANAREPRGEYVLVIAGLSTADALPETGWSSEQVREALAVLDAEAVDAHVAQRVVAKLSGWRKKDVYRLIHGVAEADEQPDLTPVVRMR